MISGRLSAAWANRHRIHRKRQRSFLSDEGGYMLPEALASLPVMLMLLVSLFAVWVIFLKSYVLLMGDWELQQEMRLTLERIAQDAASAARIEVKASNALCIERYVKGEKCSTDYVLSEGKQGSPPYISKKVTGGDYGYSAPQPMTGGQNVFGSLAVVDFFCEKRDGILLLRLTGVNRRTKKRIAFSTAVFLPQERE